MVEKRDEKGGRTLKKLNWEANISKNSVTVKMWEFTGPLSKKIFGARNIDLLDTVLVPGNRSKKLNKAALFSVSFVK